MKEAVGSECPVFSQSEGGCPFKGAVCSDGSPLVDQLQYRSWAVFLQRTGAEGKGGEDEEGEGGGEKDGGESEATSASVSVPVSKLLKEGTKVAHRAAENVHYVREFIKGRVSREIYKHQVLSLYFVYRSVLFLP